MADNAILGPGIHHGIPEADYHALPYFSASAAKKLVLDCPAVYRYEADNPEQSEPSRPMEIGSVYDILTLTPDTFDENVVVVDANAWQTKAAKEAREAAYAAGKTPILSVDFEAALAMHQALQAQLGDIFTGGRSQVVMVWDDPLLGLRCKARVDYARPGEDIDLKTTTDPSSRAFRARVLENGHHIQAALYQQGREVLEGRRPRWTWVVQSTKPPYLCAGYHLTETWRHIGMARVQEAAAIFRACQESGEWWGYQDSFQPLDDPPTWAVYDHEEKEQAMAARRKARPALDKALDQQMRAWQAPH